MRDLHPRRLSLKAIEGLLLLLIKLTRHLPAGERPGYWRAWQARIFEALLEHERAIVQGCRQAVGKTYIAALLAVVYIILGYRVVIGMPSLRQSSRILLRRVLLWLSALERPLGLRRLINNQYEVEWNNGGALLALSTNEAAARGVQGYTCALLILDEGHETFDEYFGTYSPLVAIAMRDGYGAIVILGVGGFADSVIERKKAAGYHLEFWPAARIVELDESWRIYFEQQKRELTSEAYDKYFNCLPVVAGGRYVFDRLVAFADSAGQVEPTYYFGVDVGKIIDTTSLLVVEERLPAVNVIDWRTWQGVNYIDQAQACAEHIGRYEYSPYNVAVEVNGPGEGFADALSKIYPFHCLARVKTTDAPPGFRKTGWIKGLQKVASAGMFGVVDSRLRANLGALRYEVNEQGRYNWPHNNELSALWCYKSRTMRAIGV